ncbi:MAG: hypothetical protein AAF645_29145 [Myxococcota bacterium]
MSHTTFQNGGFSDLIDDTPTCPDSNDGNDNGVLEPSECEGFGTDNLMFWTTTDPDPVVSDGQRAIARLNFITGSP